MARGPWYMDLCTTASVASAQSSRLAQLGVREPGAPQPAACRIGGLTWFLPPGVTGRSNGKVLEPVSPEAPGGVKHTSFFVHGVRFWRAMSVFLCFHRSQNR